MNRTSLPNTEGSYVLLKIESCPRCGRQGSLHLKAVQNKIHKTYHYYYVAHYDSEKQGVHWCYVRKAVAVALLSKKISDVEDAEIIGIPIKPSVLHGKLRVRQGKSPCFRRMPEDSTNTHALLVLKR